MAKKHQRRVIKAEPAVSAGGADGADDLQVLHPERTTTIAGRAITMREYGFVEGLRLHGLYEPFVNDLHDLVEGLAAAPLLEDVIGIVAQHSDSVTQLIAQAADVEAEWVDGLSDLPGTNLLYLWWTVNAPFFMRRVFDRIKARLALASQAAGAISTPSSSSTATGPTT